ncbi:SpoIIIAH-like family protein [Paenibacillus humicola]|uniref:SpoIIIAH-like family protein n=1 Tax=Paenibacillus humicola TaxID=3110540 RepID=UPI00237B6AB4|nr:SpoIIIAH-like family protein [Paenibacillus humicola]
MNTKRQTVWLVSMLSLMVILSAYYLFTEDTTPSPDLLTDGTKQEQKAQNGATEASGGTLDPNGINVTDVAQTSDASSANSAAADSAQNDQAVSKDDQQVLDEYASSNAGDNTFNQLQEKRDQQFYNEYNQLMGATTDPKANATAANKAVEQLDQLEDKNTKVTALEEELTKQYKNAVVTEENNRYRVVVQSDKLDRSQADSIVMKVVKELGATADQVSVQYLP